MDIVVDHHKIYGVDMFCHVPYGSCRLTISPRCKNVLWLSTLVVDESHRNQGVGTLILKEIEKVAVDNRCSVISLQTWTNSWQQEWYSRQGYKVVADGYDEDMIMMSKVISQNPPISVSL